MHIPVVKTIDVFIRWLMARVENHTVIGEVCSLQVKYGEKTDPALKA